MKAKSFKNAVRKMSEGDYSTFDRIDGTHSFKQAVPNGFVDYQVRTRPGGRVFYFNFDLAREMGLIDKKHSDVLTPELHAKLLEAFSIVIINEYDLLHKVTYPKKEIRPNRYMATRYLQLQHPSRKGKTSGDGRGIWNGEFAHQGITWDVTSSGTGATCLSPAHAQTKKFFKTGDKVVGYGNGYNCVSDGMSAALMSEIFHKRGIETERTLAIIAFEGGSSINVRAGKNLLRPAHFFHQLKQGDFEGLKRSVDYFIDRQVANGEWQLERKGNQNRYRTLGEQMARTFSKIAAQFEAEYIFCWLDWDGDNILANGGIIDYGSVRQFGLYHWGYRYDDVDRMSTNIPEQKNKARYIVQNFAQAVDYLITGRKKNIRRFRYDPLLKLFDQNFRHELHTILLKKLGLSDAQSVFLLEQHPALVRKFKRLHQYFERTKSTRGVYKTVDGVTSDAIFSMADAHRELPKHFLKDEKALAPEVFIDLIKSSYARRRDLKAYPSRKKHIALFQNRYLELIRKVAEKFNEGDLKRTLLEVTMRASVANPYARITGDGVLHVTSSLIRCQKKLSVEERHHVVEKLVQHQLEQKTPDISPDSPEGKVVLRNIKAIRDYREGF